MKLIIDIPDIIFQKIERRARLGLCNDADEQIIYAENFMRKATNGDMIKTIFPNLIICKGYENIHAVVIVIGDTMMSFREDWWNAPYKENKEGE